MVDRGASVAINDPRVLAVPIADSGEPLVDARTAGFLVDERRDRIQRISENPFLLRGAVLKRLANAESRLPGGVRLQIKEGWRPIAVQAAIYAHYLDSLRRQRPGTSEADLALEAATFVAPPDAAPPHSTGGAVDLGLLSGADEIDMGWCFNEPGAGAATATSGLSRSVRRNRRILAQALEAGGFVNYPHEWWHWSYGDRYWAFSSGISAALYGPR